MAEGERYLAAIMFTDLVGYSAMMRRDEAQALELLEEHWAILRPLFPEFGGREIKTIGDAFMIEYQSALKAVQCGVAMQSILAKRNKDEPKDRHINLRIGIHLGDVEARGGDVFGDGVNIAARVEPQAPAGGICITETVYQQVHNKAHLDYHNVGTKVLKNVGPVTLYAIPPPGGVMPAGSKKRQRAETAMVRNLRRVVAASLVIGFAALAIWGAYVAYPVIFGDGSFESRSETSTLLVLPFANNSPDPGNDYVANGLTDELRIRLRGVDGLLVAPKSASQRYRTGEQTIAQIAIEGGITAVLDGSIQRAGDRLRVTAELTDANSGIVSWSDSYDRQFEDYLDVQNELATAVAEALRGALAASNADEIGPQPTTSIGAYDLYLQAQDHMNQRTDTAMVHAAELFQEAVQIDPGMVQAHVGLATAYLRNDSFGNLSDQAAIQLARVAVEHAMGLGPDRSDVQTALGLLERRTDRPAEAEAALLRAIELDDANAEAYLVLGDLYADSQRNEEELALYEAGLDVDAQHIELNLQAARAYARTSGFDRALEIYEGLVVVDSSNQLTYLDEMANALTATGDIAGAIERYVEIIRAIPYTRNARANAAYWLISLGEDAAAETMISSCLDLAPDYGRCEAALSLLRLYRGELDIEPSVDRDRHSLQFRLHGYAALLQGEPQTAVRWFWRLRDRMPRGIASGLDSGYPSTVHEVVALKLSDQPDAAEARLNQFEFVVEALIDAEGAQIASAYYARAQIAAISGNSAGAAAALKLAFESGWRNSRFARMDPALAVILDDPDVLTLLDLVDDDVEAARDTLDLADLDAAALSISAEAPALSPGQLRQYEGHYEWDAYTIATFHVTDDQLFERQTDGKEIALSSLGDDRFYSPAEFFTVRFGRGPEGRISHYMFESEVGETRWVRRIELPPTIVMSAEALDEFVGWYQAEDRPDQLTTIVREGDELIDQTTGQPARALRAIGEHVFDYDPLEYVARSTFERNKADEVAWLILVEGHDTTALVRIPEQTLVTQNATLARRMEGRYLNIDGGQSYQVISSGDLLEIRWAPAGSPWRKSSWFELFPGGDGRYFFDDEQLVAEVQFEVPIEGPAVSLVIEFGDGEVWEAARDEP